MDWLNRARQFVGNLFGGAQRTIGQISGGVARAVGQAEQQAARTAQQVVRQIPQPPRIQLPQIPQVQMPRFQAPRVQLPQAPKIDLAAVTRVLGQQAAGFGEGMNIGFKQVTGQQLSPREQQVIDFAKRTVPAARPFVQATENISKFTRETTERNKQLQLQKLQQLKESPATAIAQNLLGPLNILSKAGEASKVFLGKDIVPKIDTTKAVDDLTKSLANSPLKNVPGIGVVSDIVNPIAKQIARGTDVLQNQEQYSKGLKGMGEFGSDLATVISLFYAGGLTKQLATKGTAFLPTAARLAPRLAASGAGQNILQQISEGKKLNEIDPKQVAAAAALYTGLGVGIPGVTRGVSAGLGKALGKGQAGLTAQAVRALPTDKNALVIARSIPEKGALRAQGYTNVQVQFQPKPGQVAPTMRGAIPEVAPEAPKVGKAGITTKLDIYDATKGESFGTIVATRNGKPVGKMDISITDNGDIYVNNVYVPKQFRRQGIATELYKKAQQESRSGFVQPTGQTELGAATRKSLESKGIIKSRPVAKVEKPVLFTQDEWARVLSMPDSPAKKQMINKMNAYDSEALYWKGDKTLTKPTIPQVGKTPPTLPVKPIYETAPKPSKGVRERGFVTTVKESPRTEATTLTILKQADGSYKIKPNRILEKQANERIASNVADAKTYAMTQSDDQAVATAGQLIKYFQAKGDYGQAAEVASQAAKTLTEAGRAIQAASLYNKLNPEGILQYASSKMQKVGKKLDAESAEILTDMAKKIEAMPDGEAKQIAIKELLDEVGRTQGSALPDKIITLWKAGLLTSPITTAGNLTSNTIKQVVKKAADDPIAALVDMTLGLATGKRTKTFTLRGEAAGAVEGLKRGGKYFKTGYDPRDPISKLDQKDVYFGKGFLGKIAKGYTDTVFRSLGAQDQPYFYAALKNTLYDQALAAAKTQGVKGAAKDKFIKNFVNNPDSKILDQATEEARTAVFQNKTFLGDIASRITQSNNPTVRTLGQFIMPFSRVPSAVATEIFERTPLGAAKEIVKQISKKSYDQRALSTAISKSTTGTLGLMGLGYALDRSGSINLAMPTSQAEQNLWQQEGRQPFSVKIGDKYYSMNYIQPFGSLIAMGAQYNRTLREGGSQQDALSAAFAMGAKSVTEQSFLRGVSGALGALQDPGRYAERFVEQTAGSVVPNIVRTTARAFDPLQREITSAGEAVLAGIPGLRETLQPKVDIFGKPIARPAGPIDTLFNPLRPTTARTTPELQEVRRLFDVDKNVIPSEIDKNAFGKENPINQQQINELKTAMGNAVLNRYQQILADPRYGQLSDDQKAKALKDAKDAVIQGEKFRFAKTYDLPYTTADKLDKDTRDYLMGVTKDTIAATLPKPPKVKVSKARKARGTGRGRVARARISLKTPRLRRIKVSVPKARKVSFKQPTPTKARKSIKIKTG